MRLGVFFIGSPASGGLYQYALNMLDSLKDRHDEIIVFNLSGQYYPSAEYWRFFKTSGMLRLLSSIRRFTVGIGSRLRTGGRDQPATGTSPTAQVFSRNTAAILKLLVRLNRVDLAIFTAPTSLSFMLDKPFIMPVHDLQHRLNPQFPEVSADGIRQEREHLYSNAILGAEAILVDSEAGKEDVLGCYAADKDKIKVLPFTPPNYLRSDYSPEELDGIRRKYHLPPRFFFYPANFWAHKNHEAIVRALSYIKKKHNLEIPVVFVGSEMDKYSRYNEVKALARQLEIEHLVYYPSYVPNEDMGRLYKLAEALVMPTYFGPTNIPYLEAFALGCPVIGSDIRGVREQIGNAGLLINPDSPEELATAILKIWNDEELRKALIEKGHARVKQWGFKQFATTLNGIIDEITTTLKS